MVLKAIWNKKAEDIMNVHVFSWMGDDPTFSYFVPGNSAVFSTA